MAQFQDNYRGQNRHQPWPLCFMHVDSQKMAFQCPIIKDNVKMGGHYSEIFKDDIPMNLVKTITNIVKYREQFLQERRIEGEN